MQARAISNRMSAGSNAAVCALAYTALHRASRQTRDADAILRGGALLR
jgi:hypothetical protein